MDNRIDGLRSRCVLLVAVVFSSFFFVFSLKTRWRRFAKFCCTVGLDTVRGMKGAAGAITFMSVLLYTWQGIGGGELYRQGFCDVDVSCEIL